MCLKVQDLDGRVVSKQQLRPHAHCLFLCYGFLFQSIPNICYNILVILWHFFGYFYYQNFLVTFLVNTSNVAPFWAFWPSGVKLEPFLPFLWRIFSKTLFFLGAFALFQMLVCLCNLFQRSLCPAFFFIFATLGLADWLAAFPSCSGLSNILGKPKPSTEGSLLFSCSFLFFLFSETKPQRTRTFCLFQSRSFSQSISFSQSTCATIFQRRQRQQLQATLNQCHLIPWQLGCQEGLQAISFHFPHMHQNARESFNPQVGPHFTTVGSGVQLWFLDQKRQQGLSHWSHVARPWWLSLYQGFPKV